jgi:hypothetical protein
VIRNALYTGLLQGWVRSDVDGVTQFLMTLPDDPNGTRNRVYLGYVTTSLLGFGGPDRLISWLDGIPDDAPNDFKSAAYQNMLLQFAYEDPERAARFHTERASHDYAGNALWMVAVAWQRQDPQAAFDWLLAQPEGLDRRMAMSRAMQRWYSRDARSAARWVVRADLGDDPDLRKLLYGITRQGGRLRQTESGA